MVRWLGVFVSDGAAPRAVWMCVAARAVDDDVAVRGIAAKEARHLWPDETVEWLDAFPAVPGSFCLTARGADGVWRTEDRTGLDVEVLFAEMDASVVRVGVEKRKRDEFRRRAEPKGTETIEQLLRRDGPACCWCGVETRRDVPERHPSKSTVEHVVPISRGGRRSFRNLRVACARCNSERGNLDSHPRHALRDRPPMQYPDPPLVLREFLLPTTEDWEPTVDGQVAVSVAVSGINRSRCSIYVKGGTVQMVLRILNEGPESVERIRAIAAGLPDPVTFDGLRALGFRWVPYLEPAEVQMVLRPA